MLFQTLKQTEEELAKTQKTRDAALAKATKLSVALAKSREKIDWMKEKVEYQNSIVEKILGKGALDHLHAATTPIGETPQRQHSENSNAASAPASASTSTPVGSLLDGSRIRNFLHNRAGIGSPVPVTPTDSSKILTTTNAANGVALPKMTPTTGASPVTAASNPNANPDATPTSGSGGGALGRLSNMVRMSKPLRNLSIGKSASTSSTGGGDGGPDGGTSSPRMSNTSVHDVVDDHAEVEGHVVATADRSQSGVPINSTVGHQTALEEDVQGGGGDVTQALTV